MNLRSEFLGVVENLGLAEYRLSKIKLLAEYEAERGFVLPARFEMLGYQHGMVLATKRMAQYILHGAEVQFREAQEEWIQAARDLGSLSHQVQLRQ